MSSVFARRIELAALASVAFAAAPAKADQFATAVAESSSSEPSTGVLVRGVSKAERLRESSEAVKVVETERARRESADLGSLLARTQGVGVRRVGGLGSGMRFSLNGLQDEQIRFLFDGIPLEYVGHAFGLANVPVNLVERVEIYSGVVPVRFGADALGGVVNLVGDEDFRRTHAGVSYQAGSFDTHRTTLGAQVVHEPSGAFARLDGFFDYSQNDYLIDVEAPNVDGRVEAARTRRFHDGYRAAGLGVEGGVMRKRWARRLSLRVFASDFDKEIQHNVAMTVPYGDVSFTRRGFGATLRYQHTLGRGWSVDVAAGHGYSRSRFRDVSSCVYDWFGRCVNQRRFPGEAETYMSSGHNGTSQLAYRNLGFARVNASWLPAPQHALRLVTAPTLFVQTGKDRRILPPLRDPSTSQRDLFSLVSGVEYQLDLLDDRLANVVFAKHYLQRVASAEPRPEQGFRTLERTTQRFGVGTSARYRFAEWLLGKASYEAATRLPTPDEIFGDNAFIWENLELRPETGHNLNLGIAFDLRESRAGAFRAGVAGFLRETSQLIIASTIAGANEQIYRNIHDSRTTGMEAHLGWSSSGELFGLDGNFTWQRSINTSDRGTFGAFAGSTLPHRPSLFANAEGRIQFDELFAPADRLLFAARTHFIARFYRGWGDAGDPAYKLTVPAQSTHDALVTYVANGGRGQLSATLEVQNLTDAKVFDFYGVQKPGRALYAKMTGHLW